MLTGAVLLGGQRFGLGEVAAMGLAMGLGLALRLLALRFNWQMPKFVYRDEWR